MTVDGHGADRVTLTPTVITENHDYKPLRDGSSSCHHYHSSKQQLGPPLPATTTVTTTTSTTTTTTTVALPTHCYCHHHHRHHYYHCYQLLFLATTTATVSATATITTITTTALLLLTNSRSSGRGSIWTSGVWLLQEWVAVVVAVGAVYHYQHDCCARRLLLQPLLHCTTRLRLLLYSAYYD